MNKLANEDLMMLLLVAIIGVLGGCGSASFQVLSRRKFTAFIFFAYAMLGGAVGMMSFLLAVAFNINLTFEQYLLLSGCTGAGSTLLLAVIRIGARIFLRYKGFEIEISVRNKENQDDTV